MSKRTKAASRQPSPRRASPLLLPGLLLLLGVASIWYFKQHTSSSALRNKSYSPGRLTFTKDIAPVVWQNCAGCHRPGESGPFDLITYADIRKRAQQIAEVTRNRVMPPWLPEGGHEPLLDERRLTEEQIALIQKWVSLGAPEGNPADLPTRPNWTEGWQLGRPDLIVTMSEPYLLPADGKDVYRNFIIPVSTTENRFVRAVELRPSSKTVHHAFIRLDRTRQSRQIDAKDPGPGFGGMKTPPATETPAGHFLGWQPGRGPAQSPRGLEWMLPAGADVILLMHMQPRGAPEPVQPSLGFYFTQTAPTNTPTQISLVSYAIDIPPGTTNYIVEAATALPVATDLLAVLPHAHYLGKRLEAYAKLPDGTHRTLLLIPDWDFNWQSDFPFVRPVELPKGATIGMRYTFDNSTNNVRNPHQPPQRAKYGLETDDEMAELHFQVLAHNPAERNSLELAANRRALENLIDFSRRRLHENPTNAQDVLQLAKVLLEQDKTEAETLIRRALELQPDLADAHYTLGVVLLQQSKLPEAENEFLEASRLDPNDYMARNNAGLCALRQNKFDEAARHFQEVLRLHPDDKVARENLQLALRLKQTSRLPK